MGDQLLNTLVTDTGIQKINGNTEETVPNHESKTATLYGISQE